MIPNTARSAPQEQPRHHSSLPRQDRPAPECRGPAPSDWLECSRLSSPFRNDLVIASRTSRCGFTLICLGRTTVRRRQRSTPRWVAEMAFGTNLGQLFYLRSTTSSSKRLILLVRKGGRVV